MNAAARPLTSPGLALLIDDERHFRRFVGQVLRDAHASEVLEARHGHEGVALFASHAPAVVVLDINMPHLDGVATLVELRRLSATVPIIMLTSLADERVVEQCVEHGATYFIRKDVPAPELATALRAALAEFFHPTAETSTP